MSAVVHWLPSASINERLACGRRATLRYKNGRLYETPLYALLAIPSHGYRWCKACLHKRRSAA